MGGGTQGVERRLQLDVAAAQPADQALLVQHHAGDGAAQEMRQQHRGALGHDLEFFLAQLQQHRAAGDGGIRAAGMVADQQAEFAEELVPAQALGDEVVAEVEVDLALHDDVHGRAQVAAPEQGIAGRDEARPSDLLEQRVFVGRQRGRGKLRFHVGHQRENSIGPAASRAAFTPGRAWVRPLPAGVARRRGGVRARARTSAGCGRCRRPCPRPG